MVIRALYLVALLSLGGCGGIPSGVLIGLQVTGALIGLADKVGDIDVSWDQDKPDKVSVAKILLPPALPGILP